MAGLAWDGFIGFLGTLSNIFANPAVGTNFALWASQFLDLIPGMKELRQGFSDWLHSWAEVDGSFIDTAMMKFFQDIPGVASQAWQAITIATIQHWNNLVGFIETGINGIIKGFVSFVNQIINGINKIISGINKLTGSNIARIQPFVVDQIKLGRVSLGYEVGSPAGAPNKGQIGPSNTYITVQGSVIAERQLEQIMDDKFKQWMKDRGFTGF